MVFVFVKLFSGDHGGTSTLCFSSDGDHFNVGDIKENVSKRTGIPVDILHLSCGLCRLQNDDDVVQNGQFLSVQLQLCGGKGGFGSMLRAIGAQIEKTTNKEACRDLSGRRLRDINEEKRLKKWIAKQAEREREKAERKRLRLERMRAAPHHEFHDSTYDKQRSNLAETISDSLSQGLQKKRQGDPVPHKSKVAKSSVKPNLKGWGLGVDDIELEGSGSSTSETEDNANSSDDTSSSSSSESGDDQPSCSETRPVTNQLTSSSNASDTSIEPSTSNGGSVPTSSQCTKPSVGPEKLEIGCSNSSETANQQLDMKVEETKGVNLEDFNSIEELEEVGLDRLKYALMTLGMKCGGTLRQRAERLFSVKGLKKEDIDPSLLAKPSKSR